MQNSKQKLVGAVFGLVVLGSSGQCADNSKVPGLWKVVAFHSEDTVTKEHSYLYGERPIGFMKLETDGRLSAWVASGWPLEPVQSVWEDAARSIDPQRSMHQAIFYSGKYHLNGTSFVVNIDQAQHEGPVGAAPFDLTWTEGRTMKDETRNFRIETDVEERETLTIETSPMRNPNGAGGTILGRGVWVRVSEWEFGRPN